MEPFQKEIQKDEEQIVWGGAEYTYFGYDPNTLGKRRFWVCPLSLRMKIVGGFITLSEASQTDKDKHHMISLTCGI